MKIGAYTAICEEDSCWIDQYLAEAERLEMPFAIYFDRCSQETVNRLSRHPLFIGGSRQDDKRIEFNETRKQIPFDILVNADSHWAMAWDIDETYESTALQKIRDIMEFDISYVDIKWVNLWDDPQHIRVDGAFSEGHRVKFYNLKKHRFQFMSKITNGPRIVEAGKVHANPQVERIHRYNLVCLHWGMMTHEIRVAHKQRWDRIYTAAVGANPYGFWNYALDYDTYQPTVVEHHYR